MAELQRSMEFPTLEAAKERAACTDPTDKADELRLPERMQNLALVLERFWRFYQAMHNGKPLENSGEVLPQMGTALKKALK